MRRIGLIGGTSWESTAHYFTQLNYTQLNQGVRTRLGGFHSADPVLRSAAVGSAAVPLLDSTALHVTALLDAALAPPAAAHQTLSPEEGAA